MVSRIHPKKLLVEGNEDKRVIPELIEANDITWGETSDEAIVFIKEFEGLSNLLKPGVIEAELKASGTEIVGIMADANCDAQARFRQIRGRIFSKFPTVPEVLPSSGLILSSEDGPRFGIWLMPDNQSRGMLETFLMYLAPEGDELARYAEEAIETARRLGAPFKPVHRDKAKIFTWLAWQDEPGAQLHQAVKKRVLNPTSPHAMPFLNWFRELFGV